MDIRLSREGKEFVLRVYFDDKPVGKAIFILCVFDEKTVLISDVEVNHNYRGCGFGTELVKRCVEEIWKFNFVRRILIQDGSAHGETSKIALKLGFTACDPTSELHYELFRPVA